LFVQSSANRIAALVDAGLAPADYTRLPAFLTNARAVEKREKERDL